MPSRQGNRFPLPTLCIPAVITLGIMTQSCQITADSPSPSPPTPPTLNLTVTPLQSPVTASLRGVHAISEEVCWASGTGGVWLRTTDGGQTWRGHVVDGAQSLDFRDVHAFDQRNALLLVAGDPARIYRTTDAGNGWSIVHEDRREGVFFDAMAFWDEQRGVVFSDPVDGTFVIATTADGGQSWTNVPADAIPPALDGEAGFAASGTCLAVGPDGRAWIGLGGETGNPTARLLRTADFGHTWTAHQTPIRTNESSGIFSLVFLDEKAGVAVGGDYVEPDDATANAATTADGGLTWTLASPLGYRSVVEVIDAPGIQALLAAGPTGIDLSTDRGRTWSRVWGEGFHAISFAPGSAVGYATGAQGRIARLQLSRSAHPQNQP
jgi:photosystem II stability/assembly factor-like uncharacterized protein